MRSQFATWFVAGKSDYQTGAIYSAALPARPTEKNRCAYRSGWIVAEYQAGKLELPALVLDNYTESRRRCVYIICSIDEAGRPIFNAQNGGAAGGYYDLESLMQLKGDSFNQ